MPRSVDVKSIANFSVNINSTANPDGNQLCQKLLLYGPGYTKKNVEPGNTKSEVAGPAHENFPLTARVNQNAMSGPEAQHPRHRLHKYFI